MSPPEDRKATLQKKAVPDFTAPKKDPAKKSAMQLAKEVNNVPLPFSFK